MRKIALPILLIVLLPLFLGVKYFKGRKTPPVADYNVSGDISPDSKGNYFFAGIYGEQNYSTPIFS